MLIVVREQTSKQRTPLEKRRTKAITSNSVVPIIGPWGGKNRCHRRGQLSRNRLLTWRTIVIVVVRPCFTRRWLLRVDNSMECRCFLLSLSLSSTHTLPFDTQTLVSSLPPRRTVLYRTVPWLSRFNAVYGSTRVASATTSPLYRRISVVHGHDVVWGEIYELCGIQRAHTDAESSLALVPRPSVESASLCFFYSSVIKQFNITNTGLDNTLVSTG